MKVLLFVQNEGDKRPKSVGGPFPEHMWRRGGERVREIYHDAAKLGPVRLAFMYGQWAASLVRSDRWWLVECADAESGRAIIRAAVDAKGRPMRVASYVMCAKPGGGLTDGRIFATGGRA